MGVAGGTTPNALHFAFSCASLTVCRPFFAERYGVHLKITGEKLDNDRLYAVAEPSRAGVRASDHASFMSKIERELRVDGGENVLLVPTRSIRAIQSPSH